MEGINVGSFYALETIYILGRMAVSRRRMCIELGLSESKTRTLLKHLEQKKHIKASTKGYVLTEKGEKFAKKLNAVVKGLKEIKLDGIVGRKAGFALHTSASSGLKAYQIRDKLVGAGAEGALVLRADANRLRLVDAAGRAYENRLQHIAKQLEGVKKNDTVIVGFAPEAESAKAAIWSIVQNFVELGWNG